MGLCYLTASVFFLRNSNFGDLHRMHGYAVRTYVMAGLPPAADAVHDHLVFRWDRVPVTAPRW